MKNKKMHCDIKDCEVCADQEYQRDNAPQSGDWK